MNAQMIPFDDDGPVTAQEEQPWELKKLKPKHLQICGLLAQGFKNVEVAAMTGVTKEYITMLLRMPVIKEELSKRAEAIGVRFELMTEKTADVIAEAMNGGTHTEKLKAARLQLEVTHRVGRPDQNPRGNVDSEDRLNRLADRLEILLDKKNGVTYDEDGKILAEDAEVLREWPNSRRAEAES